MTDTVITTFFFNEKHALLSSNLAPRTLKITFLEFEISKFSGAEHA